MKTNKLSVQPRYFKSFHCIGGECPLDCCHDWGQVRWTFAEYDKLINADMSDELRSRIDGSFKKAADFDATKKSIYTIDEVNGKCPMQDDEGLCMIQREIGEEYLSNTCRYYPRIAIECGRYITYTCTSSCYAIIDTLCNDEEAMELDVKEYYVAPANYFLYAEKAIGHRPMLRYLNEIVRFLYDIVSHKSYSLETALVLGALAAQQLTKLEENQQYDRVPEAIEILRKQLKDNSQIEKIDGIQPNGNYRIALIYELADRTFFTKINYLFKNLALDNNEVSVALYNEGRRRLAEIFKGREFYRRNLVLNMLFHAKVGMGRNEYSIYDNWLYLCAFFAEIELAMTGAALQNHDSEEFVKAAAAAMSREYSHQNNIIEKTIGFLREKGCTKPAHIALMLKD